MEEKKTKRVTFINEKGGTGKTTNCFNISWELSRNGYKILLIDLDGQGANLSFMSGIDTANPNLAIIDDAVAGIKPLSECICHIKKNLDIIPANYKTSSNLDGSLKLMDLAKFAKGIKGYDYIMFDINANPSMLHSKALLASDYVIISALAQTMSLKGSIDIKDTIEQTQEIYPELKLAGIILNMFYNNENASNEVCDTANELAKMLNSTVFDVKIRKAVAMEDSVIKHKGITEIKPREKVADDYKNLTIEFLERTK